MQINGYRLGDERIRRLVAYKSSGERVVIEETSLWDNEDRCVGAAAIRMSDLIHYSETPHSVEDLRDWNLDNDVGDEDEEINNDGAWTLLLTEE